ncbi:competence type IV pilus ATPase ComGA [uncultured Limosilactobacillus sp.]|uniref:competence type IV pilus ATPase ComGA n=1 Tax=uncultured Limosilactobacillus sp. TaxID=2837629 RepID=UPI0025D943E5|nr:competence type IV pilus ATPase ComGA [uncultured Limosilactobacillus sp.]
MDPELERLLAQLVHQQAADLYFLPMREGVRILANVSGQRVAIKKIPTKIASRWIGHLKYRANMSVTEHRRPQAGAIRLKVGKTMVDVRLSTVGDYCDRESLVVRFIYRLIDQAYSLLVPEQWKELTTAAQKRGLLLFAGPTGSGKTTTMYRLARRLDSQVIMTIEDPVEIEEPSFLQLQVNEMAGMGYQELLKVGLRHRPQVFIIGEIRDKQTAMMAVQASLSGHLVMATIHARSAAGVVARLCQLGVDDYAIDQAVSAVAYQRLLPTINGHLAVLFDLLVDQQARNVISTGKGGAVSEQWRQDLETLVAGKVISPETKQQFLYG